MHERLELLRRGLDERGDGRQQGVALNDVVPHRCLDKLEDDVLEVDDVDALELGPRG